ncbi:MAG TPA: hypothetical protein VM219_08180 [Phycisphaerae bacterium]|nr:hypothetical protein [Phycisphaerae bacterium]
MIRPDGVRILVLATGLGVLALGGCSEADPWSLLGKYKFTSDDAEPPAYALFDSERNFVLLACWQTPDDWHKARRSSTKDGKIRGMKVGYTVHPDSKHLTITATYEIREKGTPVGRMWTYEIASWRVTPEPDSFYILLPGPQVRRLPLPEGEAAVYEREFLPYYRSSDGQEPGLAEAMLKRYAEISPEQSKTIEAILVEVMALARE